MPGPSLLELPGVLFPPPAPTWEAVKLYSIFLLWLGVLSHIVPGRWVKGQLIKDHLGQRRIDYKMNGFTISLITYACFLLFSYKFGWFSATIIYDNYGALATWVLIFSALFSVYLLVSGLSSGRGKSSGNVLMDWWAGVELNPRLFGLELKVFALRPAMIGWTLTNISFAAAQYEAHGFLTTRMILYLLFAFGYSADYLFLEEAMLSTWDIITEDWGFMLCWGDLWWMVFAWTVQPFYLLNDMRPLHITHTIAIVVIYVVGYLLFRIANLQKNNFKVDPKAPIFATGKKPETLGGKILVSGLWGLMRKPNYIGDWIIAIAMSLPTGFDNLFPYLYPIYLISLDIHRFLRDEEKCSKKYGALWVEYKRRVKWALIPYVY